MAFGASATPILGPFNEGHCGVALFMCLSGYLYVKILDGRKVIWFGFYQWFASIGGFYGTRGNRLLWIVMPTIEGHSFRF